MCIGIFSTDRWHMNFLIARCDIDFFLNDRCELINEIWIF